MDDIMKRAIGAYMSNAVSLEFMGMRDSLPAWPEKGTRGDVVAVDGRTYVYDGETGVYDPYGWMELTGDNLMFHEEDTVLITDGDGYEFIVKLKGFTDDGDPTAYFSYDMRRNFLDLKEGRVFCKAKIGHASLVMTGMMMDALRSRGYHWSHRKRRLMTLDERDHDIDECMDEYCVEIYPGEIRKATLRLEGVTMDGDGNIRLPDGSLASSESFFESIEVNAPAEGIGTIRDAVSFEGGEGIPFRMSDNPTGFKNGNPLVYENGIYISLDLEKITTTTRYEDRVPGFATAARCRNGMPGFAGTTVEAFRKAFQDGFTARCDGYEGIRLRMGSLISGGDPEPARITLNRRKRRIRLNSRTGPKDLKTGNVITCKRRKRK